LAYGVDPTYPSPRTAEVLGAPANERELHMGRFAVSTEQGEGSPRHAGNMPHHEADSLMESLTLNVKPEGDGHHTEVDEGTGSSSMEQ
jgi:hypothetical protein